MPTSILARVRVALIRFIKKTLTARADVDSRRPPEFVLLNYNMLYEDCCYESRFYIWMKIRRFFEYFLWLS